MFLTLTVVKIFLIYAFAGAFIIIIYKPVCLLHFKLNYFYFTLFVFYINLLNNLVLSYSSISECALYITLVFRYVAKKLLTTIKNHT